MPKSMWCRRLPKISSTWWSATLQQHAAAAVAAPAAVEEWAEEAAGPAFQDTLRMLEWPRLCEHLSNHASTAVGKRICLQLEVPVNEATSERLLQETR
jgi:DNA mismatch repair protein MutS2